MESAATDWQQIHQRFQQIWGYEDFRPPQGEIIRSLLRAKDALVVMPTGGGKSICFQLPALLQVGLTLVVSPLVALMENQVWQLQQRRLPAALLHNELPRSQRQQTLEAISRQQLRLLYLSPETLLSPPVWQRLASPHLKLNGLILDEAHCLVQWGETFRPEYRRLGAVRQALVQGKPPGTKIPIAAFTATADSQTQRDLEQVLQLEQPERFFLSPYRPNLHLQIQRVWLPKCRRQQLLQFLQGRKQQPGLIYTRSRQESEALAQWLRQFACQTAAYHGGLSPQQRRSLEADWLGGRLPFLACTSAFGLGIDKPDVRWVVHFHAPSLLAEYLQEVGRGGRDGKPTAALAFASEPTGWLEPSDRQRDRFFAEQVQRQYQQARQIAKQIPTEGEIRAIAGQFPGGDVALSLLHSGGLLEWLGPFHYRLLSGAACRGGKFPASTSSQLQARQGQQQGQMKGYLVTRECRWKFLLTAFGFSAGAVEFRCDRCDNCQRTMVGNPKSKACGERSESIQNPKWY